MKRSTAAPSVGEPRYLTTDEVADRYRTAPSTVRYWKHIGYIPGAVKRGRRTLYSISVLNQWDEEQTGGAAA